jgi:hypothetical protein
MVSFNNWIKMSPQANSANEFVRTLSANWKTGRGRLTRATIEARALTMKLPTGTGQSAWDRFEVETRGAPAALAAPEPKTYEQPC